MKVARLGGRVLMVNASEQLLLIHERLEDGTTHWLTPGGGVEDGEHPRDAARREALEETGIAVEIAADAEPVLTTRRDWSWAGVEYDQVDQFFLARVPDGLVAAPHALTTVEQQTWLAMRWWSVAELQQTSDVLLPAQLGDILARLLARQR